MPSLVYAGNMTDPEIGRFYQGINERVNAIYSDLLFFGLELNLIAEDRMDRLVRGKRERWPLTGLGSAISG